MGDAVERTARRPVDRTVRRALRGLHHSIFHESSAGRAAEVVAWSNAAAALGLGGQGFMFGLSLAASAGVAVLAFVLLRLALLHRLTVWVAAAFGTVAIAGAAGGLAWLFAHVIEMDAAPPIAAACAGVLASILPTRAYVKLARSREADIPDSRVDPVSARSSWL
jgi:hypothetical protein